MTGIQALLLFVPLAVGWHFLVVRPRVRRLANSWLRSSEYADRRANIIVAWWEIPMEAIVQTTNANDERVEVVLRVGGFLRGDFLGVAECKAVRKLGNDLEVG